jgi:hypothetical protein
MTEEEAVAKIIEISNTTGPGKDAEWQHPQGDDVLVSFLRSNGFERLADAFDKAAEHWWYS